VILLASLPKFYDDLMVMMLLIEKKMIHINGHHYYAIEE
jgi:hypothetical protein